MSGEGDPPLFASAKPLPLPLSGEIKRGSRSETQGVHTTTVIPAKAGIQKPDKQAVESTLEGSDT